MMLGWFDAKEESLFGSSLADFFIQRLPPGEGTRDKKRTGKKFQEIMPKILSQVERFKQDRRLNMYKKAKLGNAFRWKMVDAGYDREFVDEVTKEVLVHL